MEGHLVLSKKERERMAKFTEVKAGRMSLKTASAALGLSYRQAKRSYQRYRELGDGGLAHRARGRPSNRRAPAAFREAVLNHYAAACWGYGPTLAAESLAEQGLAVDHETLRRWLLAEGWWKKKRARRAHRQRRPRRAQFGELVQMDGSIHQWFEGDDGYYCLMNMVDDAKGTTMALMDHGETTEVAMRLLWRWIERYGAPQAIYADNKRVFSTQRPPTPEEQLAGEAPRTAFGEACHKLGIEILSASSPQAKGRVERNHGVYQDRLVKKLAQLKITGVEAANELLAGGFCDGLNAKFAKTPASPIDAHRPLEKGLDLAEVFCREETRVLANDWCVQHHGAWYQVLKHNRPLPKPKDRVTVRVLLDGTVRLLWKNQRLAFKPVSQPPPKPEEAPKPIPPKPKASSKPAADHVWRRQTYGNTKEKETP